MSDPAIRVLLADDQPLVRAGLRMFLGAQPDIKVVAEAADGREAVDAAHTCRPDVVLMDVRMPNLDGVEATRLITAAPDAPRVLVLTTFDLDEIVYEALRAGASGFLLKDACEERLTTAIRVVADGGSMFAPRSPDASSKNSRAAPNRASTTWNYSQTAKTRYCAYSPAAGPTPR